MQFALQSSPEKSSVPENMALLYRFVKINDRCNTQVFTFIVTKTVTRDFHRDVTTKDFAYNYQKWAVSFNRADKYLGTYLVWRNPCVGMRCYADFAFAILNREHFSLNEVFSAKQCRFHVDQTANGNRKLISVSDLHGRSFTDENGEFLLEVTISNVRNVFESDMRVPHPLPAVPPGAHGTPKPAPAAMAATSKLESNYFVFGNFEWNISLLLCSPTTVAAAGAAGSAAAVATASAEPVVTGGNRLLVNLNRLTGFDHQCRVRYRIVLGEGERRADSGAIEDFSNSEGRGYGWPIKCHPSELAKRGVIRVQVEMFSANSVSEVKVCAAGTIGASAHCYDRDKQAWTLEADTNTELLRLKIVYKDVFNVPRNHLRYVSWTAHVMRRHAKTGGKEPITVLAAPISKYYIQDESDEGVIMETGIPMREIVDPSFRYLESSNQITVHIEWIESLLLFQSTYHKYDDTARAQNFQMKREITALQAENYSLERQLFSYQKSLAYQSSRGQYSDDAPTPDGYFQNHVHGPPYDDRSLSETD